jgi:hypothetical protein
VRRSRGHDDKGSRHSHEVAAAGAGDPPRAGDGVQQQPVGRASGSPDRIRGIATEQSDDDRLTDWRRRDTGSHLFHVSDEILDHDPAWYRCMLRAMQTTVDIDRTLFEAQGYFLAKSLFSTEEAADLLQHVRALVGDPTMSEADTFDPGSPDPLRRYPRLMQPHLHDRASWDYVSDARLEATLLELLGSTPSIVQTMVYFKPPGARGQALHQDNSFLQVDPGTCVAAWLALEPTDQENGCLQVVPGSHRLDLLCPVPGDTSVSFTAETVPLPPGADVVDVPMSPGDVLFFHGNLIHGSEPNISDDRFRTIIVGHYATGDARKISDAYPVARTFSGEELRLQPTDVGGPCGSFVDGEFAFTSMLDVQEQAH